MFRFEKLDIWKKSVDFASDIYRTTESFPSKEQFGLTSQMRRSAVSIAANIAEGSTRGSSKEFSRYIEIAFGSLCEVIAEIHIASDRSYISKDELNNIYNQSEELGKMLSKFRASLETSWIKTSQG